MEKIEANNRKIATFMGVKEYLVIGDNKYCINDIPEYDSSLDELKQVIDKIKSIKSSMYGLPCFVEIGEMFVKVRGVHNNFIRKIDLDGGVLNATYNAVSLFVEDYNSSN